MRLGALHQRFLQHCAVEKRLRPHTIAAYRSDFIQFLVFLRRRRSRTLSPRGRGQGEGSVLLPFVSWRGRITTRIVQSSSPPIAARDEPLRP